MSVKLKALVFDATERCSTCHQWSPAATNLAGAGHGAEPLWRDQQIEYTWKRSLMSDTRTFREARRGLRYECTALGFH